jgi:hypothetical protein
MAPRTKQKKPERKRMLRGFLVAHSFTPYRFSTRITPPYFETDNVGLGQAIAKSKGIQELTPTQMGDYKKHLAAVDPTRIARDLRAAADKDEDARQAELEAARSAEARANTKAAAAAEKVAELGGDDADLFGAAEADEEDAGPGISSDDLDAMTDLELLGVLEAFGIKPPRVGGRSILLPIAQQAVGGKIKPPAEDPAEASE